LILKQGQVAALPDGRKGFARKGVRRDCIYAPLKVFVIACKYKSDYPLLNGMVLGLKPDEFDAKVCYLAGSPDGKNTLDRYGKALYLENRQKVSWPKRLAALVGVLRKEKPDIIHCHRHQSVIYGLSAAFLARIRPAIISHVHGARRTRSLRRRLMNAFLFKRVDRVVAVSDGVKEDILETNFGLAPGKVSAVYNGIKTGAVDAGRVARERAREKLGIPEGVMVFGTVGRLVPKKRQALLIEAFAGVLETIPSARLVVVGDGPLREELEKKAMAAGISGSVKFLGFRRDVPELLPGFDAFVFTSRDEGLPLALLEAMDASLAAVATGACGVTEVYEKSEGPFGKLVLSVEPRRFAEAMIEVGLLSSDERRRLGENAARTVSKNYSIEAMCKGLESVYREVLSKKNDGHLCRTESL